MRRPALALLALALGGCSGATLPAPSVVSVDPAARPASSSGPVTVTLDAVLPTLVDYGAGTATVDDRLTLKIGPRPFGPARWSDAGVVTDFLPTVLPEGSYDVTVELGDGRAATASDAFRVTAGDWPVGYTVDTIPSTVIGRPLRRHPPRPGRARRRLRRHGEPLGRRGAADADPLRAVRRGGAGGGHHGHGDQAGDYQLVVSDLLGHPGTSLPFHVR